MRTVTRMTVVSGVVIALMAAGIPTAMADDPIAATADLIADVAPDQGAVIEGVIEGDTVTAAASDTEVTVPLDPTVPLTLTGDAGALQVNLPAEVTAQAGQVAADGTIVYPAAGDGAGVAVQVLDDGATRIQTITPDADGPHEFTYTFGEGIEPIVLDDATIGLAEQFDGGYVVMATVDAPWAIDAAGNPVATSYTVEGDTLVQTIAPAAGSVYPVIADPSVSFGVGAYVKYSKSETKSISNSGALNALYLGNIICGALPWPLNGLCAADVSVRAGSIKSTFKSAANAGKCVQLQYAPTPWSPYFTLVGWKSITC